MKRINWRAALYTTLLFLALIGLVLLVIWLWSVNDLIVIWSIFVLTMGVFWFLFYMVLSDMSEGESR